MKFVNSLLTQHLQRYPRMELTDIYKLLHQAALGSGHAISDVAAARERLRQEAADLGAGPNEPMVDPISPDGRLARIHLRPFLAAGNDLEVLLKAFAETAQRYPAAPEKLARFCACVGDLAADGLLAATTREMTDAHFAALAAAQYPPARHSEAFRQAYRPAYRVVGLDYFLETLPAGARA